MLLSALGAEVAVATLKILYICCGSNAADNGRLHARIHGFCWTVLLMM